MARARAQSDVAKTPHSISLKVLRLSRPSLTLQHPLPRQASNAHLKIDSQAALAYPSQDQDQSFLLSPLLTLPATFGTTHIGETFACTLCANNELSPDDTRKITDVSIVAEVQTPSQSKAVTLELSGQEQERNSSLESGGTLQRIVRYDLREEGNHILSVTVTYVEEGMLRTYVKKYQFMARQLLSVRTKTRPLPVRAAAEPATYALEAQLENLSAGSVVLQAVEITTKSYIEARSLNAWDMDESDAQADQRPMLNPGDVLQVAFVLKEKPDTGKEDDTTDSRLSLAQLSIKWQSSMGELGQLSTGWLSCRRR